MHHLFCSSLSLSARASQLPLRHGYVRAKIAKTIEFATGMWPAIALDNPNQELPSFLGERKKIHDWNRAKGAEPFESTDGSTEKAAQAMDKAYARLFKGTI